MEGKRDSGIHTGIPEPSGETDADWSRAYQWVCRQRQKSPANADIWHLRWRWPDEGQLLYEQVKSGRYRLPPMMLYGKGKDRVAVWSASDAMVLKWVALRIRTLLPQPEKCMHLPGKGARLSLRQVSEALAAGNVNFVHRTDIRGYYAHIRKAQVMNQVWRFVKHDVLTGLTEQYVHYSVEDGGEIHSPVNGIPRGCALSPFIGASLLRHIDGYFSTLTDENIFYARYMDDFLLLTPRRWQLRRGIRQLGEFFDCGGFERHPDKTQTGRVGSGFDCHGATIAPRALNHHREQRVRLYEQALQKGMSVEAARARVQAYEARWTIWADSMLSVCLP